MTTHKSSNQFQLSSQLPVKVDCYFQHHRYGLWIQYTLTNTFAKYIWPRGIGSLTVSVSLFVQFARYR